MGTESDGLSQDELHRLGLARGPRPPRPPGKLLPFLKDLAPPWPRLGWTVLVAVLLTVAAWSPWMRMTEECHDRYPQVEGPGFPALGRIVHVLLGVLGNPIRVFYRAAAEPYSAGLSVLAVPLALCAGIVLLVRRSRPGLAVLFLLVGATGAGWALLAPITPGDQGRSPVFPLLSLCGAAAGAYFLLSAAGSSERRAPLGRAALPLLLTAAVALNASLAFQVPAYLLAYLVGNVARTAIGRTIVADVPEVYAGARWATALVGFPLVVVPALVVTEGLGLRAALSTLVAAVRRQPAGMLLAYLGLAIFAAIPMEATVGLTFGLWFGPWYYVLPIAVATGTVSGLFLYATTRVARAARRCVEGAR